MTDKFMSDLVKVMDDLIYSCEDCPLKYLDETYWCTQPWPKLRKEDAIRAIHLVIERGPKEYYRFDEFVAIHKNEISELLDNDVI